MIKAIDRASKVLYLLQLDASVVGTPCEKKTLHDEVMTKEGWSNILAPISNDSSIAHSVYLLQNWIVLESDWPKDQIRLSEECLRSAIYDLLRGENASSMEPYSLELLAETMTTTSSHVEPEQSAAFADAAYLAAKSSIDNGMDSYSLRAEIDILEKLEAKLNLDLKSSIRLLSNAADLCEEKEASDTDNSAEEYRYEMPVEELDVDDLFLGLAER